MTRIERATRELMAWLGLLVENAEPRASRAARSTEDDAEPGALRTLGDRPVTGAGRTGTQPSGRGGSRPTGPRRAA